MRSREETLRSIDDKLFGVYVTSESSTGAGCALLAQRNGSMTVLIAARKSPGSTPKVGSEVDNGKSELERKGSGTAIDLIRVAKMRVTTVSKQREDFAGCSRKWAV